MPSRLKLDHLPDTVKLVFESPDVLIGKGSSGLFFPCLPDHEPGSGVDEYRSFGGCGFHPEIGRAASE
jgi:hypothetical protein